MARAANTRSIADMQEMDLDMMEAAVRPMAAQDDKQSTISLVETTSKDRCVPFHGLERHSTVDSLPFRVLKRPFERRWTSFCTEVPRARDFAGAFAVSPAGGWCCTSRT